MFGRTEIVLGAGIPGEFVTGYPENTIQFTEPPHTAKPGLTA